MGPAARRTVELALVFGALPLGVALGRHGPWPELPVIPILLVLGGLALAALVRDPGLDLRRELAWRVRSADLARVARRFVLAGAALVALVLWLRPEWWLSFPRERPGLWALVMVGYPVVSVLPQELVFRTFFFRRYAPLFAPGRPLLLASAAAFGWAHVVFWNWPAVALTLVGGLFFAETYRRTRCLWTASIEHALYGGLVFTVGLGHLFYGGTVETLDALR